MSVEKADREAFKSRVKALLKEQGLTQGALEKRIGASSGTLTRVFGGRKNLDAETLAAIASGLGVPAAQLLELEDVVTPEPPPAEEPPAEAAAPEPPPAEEPAAEAAAPEPPPAEEPPAEAAAPEPPPAEEPPAEEPPAKEPPAEAAAPEPPPAEEAAPTERVRPPPDEEVTEVKDDSEKKSPFSEIPVIGPVVEGALALFSSLWKR
ncbi:MAG: helix-turn-helix transcriptional regulator [Deltaproteobacteria bacterium]|nr:helix-turn-helix transcriptional regulator [Deltaproteobacteria bacterium]